MTGNKKTDGKKQDPVSGEVQLAWARIVARASSDPEFARLLDGDLSEAFKLFGIENMPELDPETDLIPSLSNAKEMVDSIVPEPRLRVYTKPGTTNDWVQPNQRCISLLHSALRCIAPMRFGGQSTGRRFISTHPKFSKFHLKRSNYAK